ncbi:MAG: hypothetical protein AB2A00_26380 [Myxococcota bacterium]
MLLSRLRGATPFVAALLLTSSLHAGERLNVPQLVGRSTAVALVEVTFGKGKHPDSVTLVETLQAPASGEVKPEAAWLGLCLPSKQQLKAWVKSHPQFSARPLWKSAVKGTGYRAVVYLWDKHGPLKPHCETEAMLMEHTSLSPGFEAYQAQVRDELKKKTAPATPDAGTP